MAITLDTENLKVGNTLPEAATEVEGVTLTTKWFNESNEEVTGGKFTAAGTYVAMITPAAKPGYELTADATYTVNGEDKELVSESLLVENVQVTSDQPEPTPINAVSITLNVENLKVGNNLLEAATEVEGVTLTTKWFNESNEEVTGEKFTAAGTYTVKITPEAKTGYELTDATTYTLNGSTIPLTEGILSVENVMVGEKEPGPATKYTVEVTEPQNGTLTVKVGGQDISSEGHDEDSDVVITAKPDMGYCLLELKVNNGAVKTDIGADGTYTYTFKLKQNTTISATFESIPKDKYSLTVNAAPTVGGTATGNVAQLEAGAKAIVTIKPSDGYTIGIVTNNGVAVESTLIKEGEAGSYTYEFTMPADNVAINVIFVHVKVAYNPVAFGEIPENASAVKNSTIDAEQLAADEEANKEIADVIKNLEGESKVTVYFEMAVKSYEESTKILKLDITPMYKAGEGEAKALKAQITSPVEITISLPDAFKDVAKVYVIHKNNVTPADVKEGKAEFTNKDGFSEFTITASDPRHTITFDANGGSVTPTSATTRGDETLESLPVPTRSNYKFDGWFTAKDGGTKVTTSSKFTQNATIYAHWTYNGGSSGGSSSSGGGSSYHGGGSSGTTYAITTQGGASNGSVSLNPNRASKGKTVTITVRPDEGYELEALTVTDAKGSELTLTEKGDNKYTFTMPSSAVSVAASFKAVSSDGTPVQFTDVPADKFCYDAVQWAVENGITNGNTRTTFNPNGTCTRAQMVTFLWRAAGAPAVTGAMSFTDIAPDAYYYQAVLWAVQQGITTGTTDTAFNPDGIVNRAQTVTFLYRYAGSPEESGTGHFADVPAGRFYTNAVSWAVAKGITNGTGNGQFSPYSSCTRGQTVTFLYRMLAE